MVHDIFGPLSSNLYIYKSPFAKELMSRLNEEEKKLFNIDVE